MNQLTIILILFVAAAKLNNDFPSKYSECSCHWTKWMNSDSPADDTDDETYRNLRSHGFQFCEKPVAVQCKNIPLNQVIDPATASEVTCDVDLGLKCSYFCDDYEVRVACCYCPPKSKGPTFQMVSEHTGQCLSVNNASIVSLDSNCVAGNLGQLWSWVSQSQIKSNLTQQCIGVRRYSDVITVDCDATDENQRWSYDKTRTTLWSGSGYLSSRDGRFVYQASDSRWLAQVDIGKIDLMTMQGWPCKSEPPAPSHGTVNCSFGSYQGSECHFICDAGYALSPNSQYPVMCMRNRQYNGSTPACQRITCQPEMTSPSNGGVTCSDSAYLDSRCEFRCDSGYELKGGASVVSCVKQGEWSAAKPRCERIVCQPDLASKQIDHTTAVCTDSNFFASKCTYTCKAGYKLVGSHERVCETNSSWSGVAPECRKVHCPSLQPPADGAVQCSDDNFFMSSCVFECNRGYTLVGSGSVSCNADRTWDGGAPHCERKFCSRLKAPSNGSLSCSDSNFFDSTCSFSCQKGFQVSGDKSLNCTADGWSHGSPDCDRISCPHLRPPVNGDMTCTDDRFYGSICSFSCKQRYVIKGSRVLMCGDQQWNATAAPTCKKILCPPYPSPSNGQARCYPASYEVGSVCLVTCSEGYILTPPNVPPPTCENSGKWGGTRQSCRGIECVALNSPRDGSVQCTDYNNYQSKCTFTCRNGFNLYGASETICGANGWDAQTPTCDRVLCVPQLLPPANGKIKCSPKGVLTCSFSCNTGFVLIGHNNTECQSDGSWTKPNSPVCQRRRCSSRPAAPPGGSVQCSEENLYGSECRYTCERGYEVVGDQLLTCRESGDWSGDAPTCQRVSCTQHNPPSHGGVSCTKGNYFASVCTFSCVLGYELIGSSQLRCLADKTWSSRPPYCERVTCSPGFSNPSNGYVKCSDLSNFGSECTFECNHGFMLEGKARTVCGKQGWSITVAPSCKKITCIVSETVFAGGVESCDGSNDYLSQCEYRCKEGFELQGTTTRQCLGSGNWSRPRPTCSKMKCPALSIKQHHLSHTCDDENALGSECVFSCSAGYRLVGSSTMLCGQNKSWQPTASPRCDLIKIQSTSQQPTKTTTITEMTTSSNTSRISTIKSPTGVVDGNHPSVNTTSNQNPSSTTTPTTTLVNVSEAEGSIPIIPIAVAGGVLVILVVIVIAVLQIRKRGRKRPLSKGISLRERYDDSSQLQKLISSNGGSNRRFPAIAIDRLESEFSRKHADDDKLFREEFASLPESQGSREQGGKVINKEKNRYTNIIPYDHSRVVLPRNGNGNGDSDYINASFIDGYKHKGKFIAAQGPKECTVQDFWRMVWDQNVTTVIMVTNLVEGKETKCAQYWPQQGSELYGDLNVCFVAENHLVDYTVRKFTIQQVCGESTLSMRRNLTHYHFTSWPDFGVPKSPSGMLKFLRKIKHGSPSGYGAIVVHCSAGVGRTGTFICLDAMLDMMMREGKVDVFGFVAQMRSQRPEMVQTEQQYIFIYQAVLEHHLYGDTEIEAADVTMQIDELNKRMPGNVTGMEHEFKKLTTIRIQKEQMRAGNHPANMRKNRVLLILPYDWNRVILPVMRGVENSDYINASYIDGYRQKDAYIATQGPLPHTVEDFWRMIWDKKSASIVMLTELIERGQAKCEQYWPNNDVMIYGTLSVEQIGEDELEHYTTRDFVVTSTSDPNERKQIVRQFHYHSWPESGPPVSGYSMIALVEQVQKQQQTSGNHPITIHCSAGAGRTGAFCALSTALEQVKAEGVLDMFQIVKCLRMQRPHMVQNLDQYEFCYRAVQEYVDSMSEYYNFK